MSSRFIFSFNQGGIIDSVEAPKRDWEGLARKIRNGMPIRQAIISCGIPEAEALEYVLKAMPKPTEISYELKLLAERALEVGVNKLVTIAEEGPRYSGQFETVNNSDLIAAQALAKLGVEVLKMSVAQNPEVKARTSKATLQLDLWDSQGAWELKKPGAD